MKPIPSIVELNNRMFLNMVSNLGLSDVQLKMVLAAMNATLSGELKLIYLLIQDVQRNQFPDTADPVSEGGELEHHGAIQLKRGPFTATSGVYSVAITGVAGSEIAAQVTFKSNDTSKSPGNLYVLDNAYTLTGTDDVISLRSLNAGESFLLNVGDGLTVTQPVIGLDTVGFVSEVTTQPTEAESTALYRQNILDAIRLEPQGGAKADYRIWAADAAGVQRVYPYVKQGDAGTVQVFVEATSIDSTDGKGTPSDALKEAVESVIEFDPDTTLPTNARGRRPAQAVIEVDSVIPLPVDVEIIDLETDNSSVRASILANLQTFLFNVRPFIAGCDLDRDKNDIITTVKVQSVVADTIGNTNSFLGFNLSVDGVIVNTYTFSLGNIPYLRNVVYS